MAKSVNTIKAIIADDESLARNLVRKYLSAFQQIEIIAECADGLTALNKINELKPDLVFLDVQMPELDGLALLRELTTVPLVIFTTAYNQYAIKAFEMNAVDYLLKPFDKDRFAQAVNKALDQKNYISYFQKQISHLQQSLSELLHTEKQFASRILIKSKENYFFLDVGEITWFEAFNDYVKIHCKEKIYLKNTSLNEVEIKLNPKIFIRIHRSSIVNVNFIKELKPYFNGEYYLYLSTGEKLKLSRTYKDKIKLIIGESI